MPDDSECVVFRQAEVGPLVAHPHHAQPTSPPRSGGRKAFAKRRGEGEVVHEARRCAASTQFETLPHPTPALALKEEGQKRFPSHLPNPLSGGGESRSIGAVKRCSPSSPSAAADHPRRYPVVRCADRRRASPAGDPALTSWRGEDAIPRWSGGEPFSSIGLNKPSPVHTCLLMTGGALR